MAPWLIVLTGLIYLGTSVDLFYNGKPWHAVMFFGYVIGNVGLYKMVTDA